MTSDAFLRGVSACAVTFALIWPARGQEALPTIDVAGQASQGGASNGDAKGGKSEKSGGRETGYSQTGPVSSSKTNIPILQLPYAVQVVPRQTMDDRQAVSLRDALAANVSSVSGAAGYYDTLIVRGFNVGDAVYRNGLRQQETSGIETTNLQSIEVLKGPAAMLFGRVQPGGMINFVPKRPQATPYVSVQEQAGLFGQTRTSIDLTGPLSEDKALLYRLNVSYLDKRSFQPYVGQSNLLIAPTISWRPTEQFTLNLDGEYHRLYFTDASPIPAVGFGPAKIPISSYLLAPAFAQKYPSFQERELFAYDWTYEFMKDWSVTNRFSYTNVDYKQRGPGLGFLDEATGMLHRYMWDVPASGSEPVFYRRSISTNVDLKGKAQTGPLTHDLLAGFDYYNSDLQADGHCCKPLTVLVNIYKPVYEYFDPDGFPDNYRLRRKSKWTGLYLQDQLSFFDDRVHLLIGGRHDWAEYSQGASFTGESDFITDKKRVVSYTSANSPRLGLSLQPFPWMSVYGNYTRSYGESNGVSAQSTPLPSQVGVQFEGGVKTELLDGQLTATFAYYDIEKKNMTRPIPGTQFVRPIGAARSNGVEFDLKGRIDENWSVIANFSHLDARITKDEDAAGTGGNTGRRLASVPHNMANLWMKYEASDEWKGLALGSGVSYNDKQFGDDANTFELPAYAKVDLMASYKFAAAALPFAPDLTFQINVTNLLGTTFYEGAADRVSITPGAPRAFLASLRAEF
ncbi:MULTISPECIES: TonB-dependent siderophore receptor [Methylosinus]|uniref:TonB-dependent siderophore receptor n=1 Tax=Methylosinus trichosporium (strain ATCC 35070 / NCIMB 11131 / UNIQEM 75 / OB3b) TaxID=595536 RepID=A0A2D2CXQ4_METT3|nr:MULTISPECIES: TonB-dependent siderophore receptor [Methylosinus]ATQ67532.1 TonB-dependent siderophore receptor [Methylosinus trichosporium OB3b]OBS50815.1 TonB-dependent receptor [Methylosinus sp. 3S-1]